MQSIDQALTLAARAIGLLLVMLGAVMWVLTGEVSPVTFGTGGLLAAGGGIAEEVTSALGGPGRRFSDARSEDREPER